MFEHLSSGGNQKKKLGRWRSALLYPENSLRRGGVVRVNRFLADKLWSHLVNFLSFLWSHAVKHIYILPRNIIVVRLAKDLNVLLLTVFTLTLLRLIRLHATTTFTPPCSFNF